MATLSKEQVEQKLQQLQLLAEQMNSLTKELAEAGAIELSEEEMDQVAGGIRPTLPGGIPFIYSEQDSDFDNQPYVLKAPADESPIDIQQIIEFINHFSMKPDDVRKTVAHLAWKNQMRQVVDQVALI